MKAESPLNLSVLWLLPLSDGYRQPRKFADFILSSELDIATFMTQVGRFFQIRDDYQNLLSNEVSHNQSMRTTL